MKEIKVGGYLGFKSSKRVYEITKIDIEKNKVYVQNDSTNIKFFNRDLVLQAIISVDLIHGSVVYLDNEKEALRFKLKYG